MPATKSFITFWCVLGVVALSPLPLASNRPWSWSLLALLVGLIFVYWTLGLIRGTARASLPAARLGAVALPFVAVLVWSVIQCLPLGQSDLAHPLWAEAAATLGTPLAGRVSVGPDLTLTALMRLICYGGVFYLSAQLCRDRSRARLGLVAVGLINLAYAVYGLAAFVSGAEMILWLEKWAYRGDLTSTFVNRNSYGAFAGMGVVVCVAMFLHEQRRRHGEGRLGLYLTAERLLSGAAPWLLAAMTLGTALMLSHSRGAFLCSALALLCLIFCLMQARVVRARSGFLACAGVLLVGAVVVGLSGDGTVDRLAGAGGQDDLARLEIYLDVLKAIAAAPWSGYGLGTFQQAFLMVRGPALDQPVLWLHAHNVFLESVMDLGLPGAVALIGAVAAAVGICLRGLVVRRRDHVYPAVAVAVAVLLGAHGVVDFSVQMPAVAVTFAFVLGIGVAQSFNTGRKAADGTVAETEAA